MSRTPLGVGNAIHCGSRDNGVMAAVGGAAPLMVRAACGENQSVVQLTPVRAVAGGSNATNQLPRCEVSWIALLGGHLIP